MVAIDYPGRENHAEVHRMFSRQVELMSRQLEGGELISAELLNFLLDWWTEHIQTMDRAYTTYCEGKEAVIEAALLELADGANQ